MRREIGIEMYWEERAALRSENELYSRKNGDDSSDLYSGQREYV
jgi:hypothetical protein